MSDPEELRQIGERLLILAARERPMAARAMDSDERANSYPIIDGAALARLAGSMYRARRARAKYFDAGLFGEPAWDMLLDLYVQQREGRRISVTSLCHASAVPPTTALRWIGSLLASGLVQREDSEEDRRSALLSLTPVGERAIGRYLIEIARLLYDRGPSFLLRGQEQS